MKIWSVAERKLLNTWPVDTPDEVPEAISWSPDGKYLASGFGSQKKTIRIWDPQTGQEIRSWHPPGNDVFTVAWSADGSRLASGTYSQHLQVWETGTWREFLDIPHPSGIQAVAWSPDGRYLASGTRGAECIVWDSRTGQKLNTLRGHPDWVRSIAWSNDGKRLATQSSDGVRIWDPKRTAETSSLEHPHVGSFAWSVEGSRLATAGGGKVKIWDRAERRELASWDSAADYCAWHPDGNRLAVKYRDKKVEVVDAGTGRVELTLPCGEQTDGSRPLDWSPDGARLAFADALESITIHDVASGKNAASLHGHKAPVWVVRFSPDGQRLASAGWDGTVRVWDAATGKSLVTLRGHPSGRWVAGLAWSPDGKRLASAGWDQRIEICDAETAQGLVSLRGHTQGVGGLDWSPDGHRLASASGDGTVKLWNADTWEEVLSLEAGGQMGEIRWSPDGKQLAGRMYEEGTVKIWDSAAGYKFAQSPAYRLERAQFLTRRGRFDEASLNTEAEEGDPHRAVAAFTELLRLEESAGMYVLRGNVYRDVGDFDKALADYSEAIRLSARFAVAYGNRGMVYAKKGDFDKALADFNRAVELQPENPLNGNEFAWFLVTCPDRRLWKPARAVELAKNATQGEPGNAAYWNTLGVAQYRAGDYEAAIKALGKSMELRSVGDASDWLFLAMAHWQLKHTEEARRWYDKGTAWMEKKNSDDEELLRFRAEAAELLGIPLKPPAGKEKPR